MNFDQLKQSLPRHPEIVAAYVFGSALTGKMTPMSDIDVALVVHDQTPYGRALALTTYVESDVQKLFQRAGDVKVLNHIRDLPFLREVLATGKLVYEADREAHRAFVARTVIAYLDFQPLYEKMLKNYARRLRSGPAKHRA